MEYLPQDIEKKWQNYWAANKTFQAKYPSDRPKYYVLDMFPYPSGAGLHVGHPLGYIASDIVARFKRLQGYNVLHPMGYDSFGLPAEQYAIQTGQHPAITTEKNIARYREQLDRIGFSFDWDREVRTSNPDYYRWTQWIFIQLFHSWYNKKNDRAESIQTLISIFENEGFGGAAEQVLTGGIEKDVPAFSASEWKNFREEKQQEILMNFRLAYLDDSWVNWCPALGTVLANDEVKDGVSERGGHPVERKLMKQWSLRITAYAERLLNDLEKIDWTESIKEAQRNWIGKSSGASVRFKLVGHNEEVEVFTTRPDTIFGVSFLVLAPEHELVEKITTREHKDVVEHYVNYAKNRSERERQAEVKNVSGAFTGAYVKHPFTDKLIPVWIADYVLAGYGTGAVMAVPCGDQRDYVFAKHFDLPIPAIMEGVDISEKADPTKEAKMINSGFLDGLTGYQAIEVCIRKVEELGIGKGKVNYRLRDAVFGRQRYWGEPIPVYYKNGIPYCVEEHELPVTLPEVDKFLPTETGEPPLARAKDWKYKNQYEYETTTMPGWAGSSWYFLRYMDPKNEKEFASKEKMAYWNQVDLYMGGAEHATGHLLYFRFWTKFLFDIGYIQFEEPAKKLINQGMIQGVSKFAYRINGTHKFVSYGLKDKYQTTPIHVDVNFVDGDIMDIEEFKKWREDFAQAEFELEDGKFICGSEVEKMSKSKWNVVNPDLIIEKFGTDTLRLYEMFLGPLEQHKPWDTKGIEGTSRFLKKMWRLFHNENGFFVSDDAATKEELKSLHKCMRKVYDDIERYSFNTVVSTLMICVNELSDLKCNKRSVLSDLVVLASPYAPHIAEELWSLLGNKESVSYAQLPVFNAEYLVESAFTYPIQFNGKLRFNLELPADMQPADIEKEVLAHELTAKYLEGKTPKKVIVVPKRIVNFVV
ncbi:MAG: leucine--tRNA ligase [Flavobacteriales bacterium]|nr:leucine--tRNA ligase [Flavobacteriales bacterium]